MDKLNLKMIQFIKHVKDVEEKLKTKLLKNYSNKLKKKINKFMNYKT